MQITDEMVEKAKAEFFKTGIVDVFSVRAALTAALSDQERAVEVKPCGWIVTRKSGGGIFMSAERYDEASAAAEADIHDRGYYPVYRSALVDVPVEPVAWQWRHPRATGGEWVSLPGKPRRGPLKEAEYRPLYASPPLLHGEGEDSAEPARKFGRGVRLRKTKGSSWQGRVVGFYSTSLTPIGYCIESEREPGSVQIYPEGALERVPEGS